MQTIDINPDSIEHTFIHCQESTDFFTKTLGRFHDFHKTKIKLSNRQIVFNTFEESSPPCLLILLQKKHFYTCKSITGKPNLDEFVSKLLEQFLIENGGNSYFKYMWQLTDFYFNTGIFLFFIFLCEIHLMVIEYI